MEDRMLIKYSDQKSNNIDVLIWVIYNYEKHLRSKRWDIGRGILWQWKESSVLTLAPALR